MKTATFFAKKVAVFIGGLNFLSLSTGQRKIKGRALIHNPFAPGASAVPCNDALNIRQSNARALKLLHPVQTLKHPKQLVNVLHIESNPIVSDKNSIFVRIRAGTNFNLCRVAR